LRVRGFCELDNGTKLTARQVRRLACEADIIPMVMDADGVCLDMGREVRLIRALADEGFQYGPNGGEPPIPRDKMTLFATLPKHLARTLMAEIEASGIPVVMLRGEGQINPDGVRDYDLLVPATVEARVIEHHSPARDRARRDAASWRATFPTDR
ncbi:MAG: hypothetical protein ACTS8Z_09240, partial [Candidatus Limnocylindrales bacterium]